MDIFSLIKTKSIEKNSCQFLKFLEYFYETYLIGYDMKKAKLINIKYDRSDLTKLWFECLTNLNNIL
ncbi:hypothetical protein H8356DRAFT_1682112 [Neocallimastix lanati (nom. inval.)]|nr:hypothetical protein H8356DRAFT_1682112 [Neocallimastix sp. JGI-2020a]